jgi:hypothetical protein
MSGYLIFAALVVLCIMVDDRLTKIIDAIRGQGR